MKLTDWLSEIKSRTRTESATRRRAMQMPIAVSLESLEDRVLLSASPLRDDAIATDATSASLERDLVAGSSSRLQIGTTPLIPGSTRPIPFPSPPAPPLPEPESGKLTQELHSLMSELKIETLDDLGTIELTRPVNSITLPRLHAGVYLLQPNGAEAPPAPAGWSIRETGFHHLRSDGCWSVLDEDGNPSDQFRMSHYAVMPTDFHSFVNDPAWRDRARRILIATYFRPEERRLELYSLFGMPIPTEDEISRDANFHAPQEAAERGRETRFRLNIVAAYNYTCALTAYRLTTISAGSIVDAAHIHRFADSRNNDPKNGLALSKNAHWLFDQGLWTIADDYRVIVAVGRFAEDCPDGRALSEYHGQKLRLPEDKSIWPALRHVSWHRKHCFQG